MSAEHEHHSLFLPLVFAGGSIFEFGLGFSQMARLEVVPSFLQFDDFGLVFVMFGAAAVTGLAFFGVTRFRNRAPLTDAVYGRRLKTLDKNVAIGGGGIFGVGWGLSGICPGAAYASLGIGNFPILGGVARMFVGAYVQGFWRSPRASLPDDRGRPNRSTSVLVSTVDS